MDETDGTDLLDLFRAEWTRTEGRTWTIALPHDLSGFFLTHGLPALVPERHARFPDTGHTVRTGWTGI